MPPLHEWKTLERHSLSGVYPDISGRAWNRYVENLRLHGIVGDRKVVLHEGKVIDGWQLQRACVEADVRPDYEVLTLSAGMTAEEYVETVNDLRRHETQEQALRRIEERRQRVAAARGQGQSVRAIAKEEGISNTQVCRDIQDALGAEESSGVPHGTPGPGVPHGTPELGGARITGLDGKSYPAHTQADRGPDVPERLRPIFADIALFEKAARQAQALANLFQLIEQTPAYKAAGRKNHREHSTYIRAAGLAIKAMTPSRPCPGCGGAHEPSMENDPCEVCQDRGYQTGDEVEQ